MLDVTANHTAWWLRQKLRDLVEDLKQPKGQGDQNSDDEDHGEIAESPVAFFLQTGNTFHTPAYFQVIDMTCNKISVYK